MSYNWAFYSMPYQTFNKVVGGGDPDIETRAIEAVTWEKLYKGDDEQIVCRLARSVIRNGIDYALLHEKEALMLDEVVRALFSSEGLAEDLELDPESPDGLHPSIVEELLSAAGNHELRLLPILTAGRRFRTTAPSSCEYCILSTEEVSDLLSEVEQIITQAPKWSADYVPDVINECLCEPLASAKEKGRALYGQLS